MLGLDRLQEFLARNDGDSGREFHVLAACAGDSVVGTTVFSYVPASGCGLSEYIVARKDLRRSGLGRRLFDHRKAVLEEAAMRHGLDACRGLFIEAEHPDRTPQEILAAEQDSALDAWQRWRIFDHFGFRRVDLRYVQPSLAEDKAAVEYLELLFLPWDGDARVTGCIPATWVLDSVLPIWRAWAPRTYRVHYNVLRHQLGERSAALRPLLDG